jgi:hypothetical protein
LTTFSTARPRRGPVRRARRAVGAVVGASVLVAVLASGTAVAAQGSSVTAETVSPAKWSANVCTALVSYKNDAAKLEKAFEANIKNPKSLSEVKTKFTKFLNDNVSRANQLIASLKKAGTPNAPQGAQFASAIKAGFVQLHDGFQSLVGNAKSVPTGSVSDFESAFNTLQSQLNDLETRNQTTFQAADQFSSPQLNAAFQGQKSCKALSNS